jgi:antitoxin component of RelBE/YafQ-DinJ toxin-antitoxin module
MISTRVSSQLECAATKAARTVGLSVSDLVRVGLQRVVDEIALNRCLTLQPQLPETKNRRTTTK